MITRDPALLKLIQRSTRLATFDLLLPPLSISLRKGMETAGHSTEIVAMVLELQLLSLEPSLQKPEAQAMIPTILTELLSIYSPLEYPIRRAR